MMNTKIGVIVTISMLLLANVVAVLAFELNSSVEEKKWTYMIYAGDDPQDANISDLINKSLEIPLKINHRVNIVILCDLGASILANLEQKILPRSKLTIIEKFEEINIGNYTTLRDFIIRCKNDFPAERYFLHIHGHGHAWYGTCYDEDTNEEGVNEDHLTLYEIKKALEESGGVDILEFTSCFMGNFESVYEIRDYTDVIIASEEAVDLIGFPVALQINYKILRRNYYRSTEKIAEKIVKSFKLTPFYFYRFSTVWKLLFILNAIKYGDKGYLSVPTDRFTISAMKTEELNDVCNAINELSELLIENLDEYKNLITQARLETDRFGGIFYRDERTPLIDLFNFADLLNDLLDETSQSDLYLATKNVTISIENAVLSKWNQYGHKNVHGLSIFFPLNNSINYITPQLNRLDMYNYTTYNLEFTANTHWDEFLELYFSS